MSSLNIKKGDLVVVTTGSSADKGKKARVLSTSPKAGTVIVDGVNLQKHHKKPKSAKSAGGITSVPGPVDVSNVMPVCQNAKCEKTGKGVRVKHVAVDGKSVRVCYKCGESLEKAAVKEVKKAAKKEKAAAAPEKAEKPKRAAKAKKAEAENGAE